MKTEQALEILRQTGALLSGHFELRSGLHSAEYFQCALVLQHPDKAGLMCKALADKVLKGLGGIDGIKAVIAPALGGLIVGHELARILGKRFIFAEKENGKLVLRRGFKIEAGGEYLVAEDVVTRGGRVQETIDIIEKAGGKAVAVAVMVNRSGGKASFGCPMYSLIEMEPVVYEPAKCPLCASGEPFAHPGS